MPGSWKRGRRALKSIMGLAGLIALTTGVVGAWSVLSRRRPAFENLPRSVVRRTDLFITLTAGGQVESQRKTTIRCELENIGGAGAGASTIIDLIDDGTMVKKGDVLCRLDASDYEERVRQQEIVVLQATADHTKAVLDLKAAEMALNEYLQGTLRQTAQQLRGQIVLGESDLKRQADRIAWAERMVRNRYVSEGELQNEQQTLMQKQVSLQNLRTQSANLERFEGPIAEKTLRAAIASARAQLAYQELRLKSSEDLLRRYQDQVESCTVRAPHDGLAILANDPRKDPKVLLGAAVRQRMKLFYLPDLTRLEVQAVLNESVVDRVQPGASARVRVEAFTSQELEGHVISVAPLPVMDRNRMAGGDVKNYLSRIEIHSAPPKLRPGMLAEVEIITARRPHALVVPNEAVAVEGGHDICYVAHDETLERRPVTLGQASRDLIEVTEGLEEGEEVILEPSRIEPSEVAINAAPPVDETEAVVAIH